MLLRDAIGAGRKCAILLIAVFGLLALIACEGAIVVTATPTDVGAATPGDDNTPTRETPTASTDSPSAERTPSPVPSAVPPPSPSKGPEIRPTAPTKQTAVPGRPGTGADAAATADIATALANRAKTATAFAGSRDRTPVRRPTLQSRATATPGRGSEVDANATARAARSETATAFAGARITPEAKFRVIPTPVPLRQLPPVLPLRVPPLIPEFRIVSTPVPRPIPTFPVIVIRTPIAPFLLPPTRGPGRFPTPDFRLPTPTPPKTRATATPTPPKGRATATPTKSPLRATPTSVFTRPTRIPVPTATATAIAPTPTAIPGSPTPVPTATPPTGGGGGGGGGVSSGSTSAAPMSLVVGAQLFSADGTFLGNLVPAGVSADSVCDPAGSYGSLASDTSIRNIHSQYGNSYGVESAFSLYAVNPPEVILNGQNLGSLTISPFFSDAIDPHKLLKQLRCS